MILPARSSRHSAGFTILELMVAMTVSLFLMAALAAVVIGGSSTNRARDRASDLQVNGRYAIDQIRRDLQHAGFLGISSLFFPDQAISVANAPFSGAITVSNVCDSATVGKLSLRVWGSNNANPYSATCIPNANYLPLTDVLVIRGLNPSVVTSAFSATTVYFRSAYEGGAAFVGPTVPDFSSSNKQPPYLVHLLHETVYYISPYTNSAAESPLVPALYRLRLSDGPGMVAELVASGVENLQLRYGIFQTNDTIRYMTANEVGSTEWDLVRSVQVSLLMRATTTEPDYLNTTSYDLSGTTITANDAYPRLLLSAVVQQRN